jgi:hypothetical protein
MSNVRSPFEALTSPEDMLHWLKPAGSAGQSATRCGSAVARDPKFSTLDAHVPVITRAVACCKNSRQLLAIGPPKHKKAGPTRRKDFDFIFIQLVPQAWYVFRDGRAAYRQNRRNVYAFRRSHV